MPLSTSAKYFWKANAKRASGFFCEVSGSSFMGQPLIVRIYRPATQQYSYNSLLLVGCTRMLRVVLTLIRRLDKTCPTVSCLIHFRARSQHFFGAHFNHPRSAWSNPQLLGDFF